MRLLLDNNLSAALVDILATAGWDAVHVAALALQAAPDEVVMEAARQDQRILVSADTDFGALLAASHATSPSMVLVRRVAGRRVEALAGLLLANLPDVEAELIAGSSPEPRCIRLARAVNGTPGSRIGGACTKIHGGCHGARGGQDRDDTQPGTSRRDSA